MLSRPAQIGFLKVPASKAPFLDALQSGRTRRGSGYSAGGHRAGRFEVASPFHRAVAKGMLMGCLSLALSGPACIQFPFPGGNGNDNEGSATFNNTTDPTNRGATFVGADACRACHPSFNERHALHGHAHILTRVQGAAPEFPDEATRAGVPDPPEGFSWSRITYVIGGYLRKAQFIDEEGFILTSGVEGVGTTWNLAFPAGGSQAGFAPYLPESTSLEPYGFSCFMCHTTGPEMQDPAAPEFQENRPGFAGTWQEAGVQCEACHGPGSKHIPNPPARDLYVDVSAGACGKCHTRGSDPDQIQAANGFILNYSQWPELRASGGHAEFDCIMCHDPHTSTNYDRDRAIRNECSSCHNEQNMALHDGFTFVRGGYREALTCESCHMPFATMSATSASAEIVGLLGRLGDMRTHIFRINPQASVFTQMFTPDGSSVAKDGSGRAAVSLDFVCLRCHSGTGNAGAFTSSGILSDVAAGIHSKVIPQ